MARARRGHRGGEAVGFQRDLRDAIGAAVVAREVAAVPLPPWEYAVAIGFGWDHNLDFVVPDGPSAAALLPRAGLARVFSGRHGVLRFPDQRLEAAALRDFSQRFGRIQATLTGRHHEPAIPEVGILSNIVENGEAIGLADAGQDWHTDMSYNETIGFLNVLYAVTVPRRDGQVLGATVFANTHAAFEDLAEVPCRVDSVDAAFEVRVGTEVDVQIDGSVKQLGGIRLPRAESRVQGF